MSSGPAAGRALPGPTMTEKADLAFCGTAPDWIAELARLADRVGLKAAGARVGYSSTTVSHAINGKYRGDLDRLEQSVRGALMGERVQCPALGQIGRNECLAWQRKPFVATSSIRVQVYRACRGGCPHTLKEPT